jgi:Flp pilus assembly protein CpaB
MAVRFNGLGTRQVALQRRRMLVYGGGSLTFALLIVGALLVYSNTVVEAREEPRAGTPIDADSPFGTVKLVAPSTRIPKGSRITKSMLREVHWPRDQVPVGALRHLDDAEGMFSNDALPANQPITRTGLAVNAPSFGIGELLPPGHRAVTIKVDAISGIEGWARAGAHVDVFLTYIDQADGVHKTRIAVEDAVVLSYGGDPNKQAGPNDSQTASSLATTVTLAVGLEDSLKIQTATAMGQITLALRNSTDTNVTAKREFSADDWDDSDSKKQAGSRVAKGFARYTDNGGKDREFVLDQTDRWFHSGADQEY